MKRAASSLAVAALVAVAWYYLVYRPAIREPEAAPVLRAVHVSLATSSAAAFAAALPNELDRNRLVAAASQAVPPQSAPGYADGGLALEFEGVRYDARNQLEWAKFSATPAAGGDAAQLYLSRASSTAWSLRALGTAFPDLAARSGTEPDFFSSF